MTHNYTGGKSGFKESRFLFQERPSGFIDTTGFVFEKLGSLIGNTAELVGHVAETTGLVLDVVNFGADWGLDSLNKLKDYIEDPGPPRDLPLYNGGKFIGDTEKGAIFPHPDKFTNPHDWIPGQKTKIENRDLRNAAIAYAHIKFLHKRVSYLHGIIRTSENQALDIKQQYEESKKLFEDGKNAELEAIEGKLARLRPKKSSSGGRFAPTGPSMAERISAPDVTELEARRDSILKECNLRVGAEGKYEMVMMLPLFSLKRVIYPKRGSTRISVFDHTGAKSLQSVGPYLKQLNDFMGDEQKEILMLGQEQMKWAYLERKSLILAKDDEDQLEVYDGYQKVVEGITKEHTDKYTY